jgi:hypothetical protein
MTLVFIYIIIQLILSFTNTKLSKNKKTNEHKKNRLIALLINILVIFVVTIWAGMGLVFSRMNTDTATLGDSFGALNTLFSGFAFIGVIIAIYLQGQELKNTQKELRGQKEELRMQNLTSKQARFENTFFSMLTAHREISSQLLFRDKNTDHNGIKCFRIMYKYVYEDYSNIYISSYIMKKYSKFLNELSKRLEEQNGLIDRYKKCTAEGDFDNYFRYLYQILKFVHEYELVDIASDRYKNDKNSEYKLKSDYINILRSQLSSYELMAIFCNCILPDFWKLKYFVIYYSLFNSIRDDLILFKYDYFLYPISTFGKENMKINNEYELIKFLGYTDEDYENEDNKKRILELYEFYNHWYSGETELDKNYQEKEAERAREEHNYPILPRG